MISCGEEGTLRQAVSWQVRPWTCWDTFLDFQRRKRANDLMLTGN